MKILFAALLTVFAVSFSNGQTTIYMRLIDYSNNSVYGTNSAFNTNPNASVPGKSLHTDEVAIATFFDGESQTLNIGSQSTGAGAGKLDFDSLVFSKVPDIQSPKLFTTLASGTPFKWAEFSFYKSYSSGVGSNNELIFYKIRLSLVALKSIQRAAGACSGDCPEIVENYTLEYGAKYITIYTQKPDGSVTGSGDGWNRVRNVRWDGTIELQ